MSPYWWNAAHLPGAGALWLWHAADYFLALASLQDWICESLCVAFCRMDLPLLHFLTDFIHKMIRGNGRCLQNAVTPTALYPFSSFCCNFKRSLKLSFWLWMTKIKVSQAGDGAWSVLLAYRRSSSAESLALGARSCTGDALGREGWTCCAPQVPAEVAPCFCIWSGGHTVLKTWVQPKKE